MVETHVIRKEKGIVVKDFGIDWLLHVFADEKSPSVCHEIMWFIAHVGKSSDDMLAMLVAKNAHIHICKFLEVFGDSASKVQALISDLVEILGKMTTIMSKTITNHHKGPNDVVQMLLTHTFNSVALMYVTLSL